MALAIVALAGAAAPGPADGGAMLPPVAEVERQALVYARLDLGEISAWKKRARMAALAPKLQVDYGQRFRNDISIDINDSVYVGASGVTVGPEDGKYSNGSLNDQNLGFRVVWDLGELVFSPKEIAASAESRATMRDRSALMADISRLYFAVERYPAEVEVLRGLVAGSRDPGKARREIFMRGVACREAAATLDGLTGGWFGRAAGGEGRLCAEPQSGGGGAR
jgi:hypothetical protein